MDGMIFISSSGAEQMLQAQTVHANNLANVKTTGYRADRVQFTSVPVEGQTLNTKTFAYAVEPATVFEPGESIPTKRELDIAIQGDGWIAVQAKDGGEAYTRNGNLTISADGLLMVGDNYQVMGTGGQIIIPPSQKVDIAMDGTITIVPLEGNPKQPVVLDRIKLVKPEHKDLSKGQDGLMRTNDAAEPDSSVRVISGYLEGSNVNAVEALTNMIAIARQYEMQMRMMKFAHENDQATQDLLMVS